MQSESGDSVSQGKQLLTTMTGELVQPVRVYYRICDTESLKRAFAKLKCVAFDSERNRYVWLYDKEARTLTFKEPYSSVPEKYQPIVIGSFFSESYSDMYLQTRSIDRALKGIVFFGKYIKKSMARVEDISIVNKVFSSEDNPIDYNKLFDNEVIINAEAKLNELKAAFRQELTLDSILAATAGDSLPEVERFPSHFHEDGIVQLKLALQSRQHVAIQHWSGNVSYSLADYISGAVGNHNGSKT